MTEEPEQPEQPEEREWFEQLLDLQLLANATLWKQLRDLGVDEDTQLRLGFIYLAPGEDEAKRLAAFLKRKTDYDVETRRRRKGWLERARVARRRRDAAGGADARDDRRVDGVDDRRGRRRGPVRVRRLDAGGRGLRLRPRAQAGRDSDTANRSSGSV